MGRKKKMMGSGKRQGAYGDQGGEEAKKEDEVGRQSKQQQQQQLSATSRAGLLLDNTTQRSTTTTKGTSRVVKVTASAAAATMPGVGEDGDGGEGGGGDDKRNVPSATGKGAFASVTKTLGSLPRNFAIQMTKGFMPTLVLTKDQKKGGQEEGEEDLRATITGEVEAGCCLLCMEDGNPRECCGKEYCDHCFGTRQSCPSCGVRLDHGVPIRKHADDELGFKAVLECRRCLKQGYRRKCCQEYYCNDCYYLTGFCPSCNAAVAKTGMTDVRPIPDPGFWPVAFSYGMVGSFTLLAMAFTFFWITNDVKTPRTVQGFTCYGILPTCTSYDSCVKWDAAAVGDGRSSDGLEGVPNMTSWRACVPGDELRLRGPTCVFDEELYRMSNKTLGYDFCSSTFDNGVNLFEEDFEMWANSTGWRTNALKSAKWAKIVNGQADDQCGVGQGNKSLHFGGSGYRYAQTEPLDVRFGALLKFQLKFGNADFNDVLHSECKPAYGGNVRVLWSTGDLSKWTSVAEYTPAKYGKNYFYTLSVDLPRAAWTNATSFRWQQSEFNGVRDHWALDYVRVVHRFPSGWKTSSLMKKVLSATHDYIGQVQCCYRTMQCAAWHLDTPVRYCEGLPNYHETEKPLHGVELYVIIAFVVSVLRTLYNTATGLTAMDWIDRLRRVKKIAADKPPPGLLTGDFSLRTSPQWQALATCLALGPFLIMSGINGLYLSQQDYTLTRTYEAFKGMGSYKVQGQQVGGGYVLLQAATPLSVIYLMAFYLDFKDMVKFLSKVVCVVPGIMMPTISVDATPQTSTFQIGTDKICLDDVVEITRFSYRYCRCLAAYMLVGVQPWASLMLALGLGHAYFPVYRIFRWVFFFCAVLKAFYGPEWLVKLIWGLKYFYTQDVRCRDEIGNQLLKAKTRWLALYWGLIGAVAGLITLSIVQYTWLQGGFFVCAIFGAIFGFVLGVAQGLPLVPYFLFTTLDTGVYVRITRRREFPCLYRCRHWKAMHERDEIVIAFVDEDFRMVSLLKGIPPPGAVVTASGAGEQPLTITTKA